MERVETLCFGPGEGGGEIGFVIFGEEEVGVGHVEWVKELLVEEGANVWVWLLCAAAAAAVAAAAAAAAAVAAVAAGAAGGNHLLAGQGQETIVVVAFKVLLSGRAHCFSRHG